jgi:hypothetical protein
MSERDELDRLIDSELGRYAEPRGGLEQRILASVEAASPVRLAFFRAWRRWVIAAAITAAVVLSIAIPRLMYQETSTTTAHVAIPEHAPAARAKVITPEPEVQLHPVPKVANTTPHVARASRSNRIAETTTRPKLDRFPAPQPLSPQEQALVAIATAPSASARETLIASQHQLDAPLHISAIDIPPITAPDEGRK